MTTPAPPRRRTRWWLVAVSTAWAVVLLVAAVVTMRTDEPTVREQRSLGQAYGPLHRAVRELVRAADPAGVIAFAPAEVTRGCNLNPVWSGAAATQEVVLRVRPGTGPDALDGLKERLPAAWEPAVRHRPDRDEHRLAADAGDFIEIAGRVEDGGTVVRLIARTGCRPDAGPIAWPGWTDTASAPALTSAAALKLTGAPREYTVDCGGDESARAYLWEGPAPADVAGPLRALAPADAFVQSEPGAAAYRDGPVSTTAVAVDGTVRLTVATACR